MRVLCRLCAKRFLYLLWRNLEIADNPLGLRVGERAPPGGAVIFCLADAHFSEGFVVKKVDAKARIIATPAGCVA